MSKYAVGFAPIHEEIQIGRLNKAGNMFLEDKEFHTNEAIYSVIQYVQEKFDGAMELKVGDKTYIVTVGQSLLEKGKE